MFKRGFTLAEVLITLGVIGVVVSLTVPSLVKDTGAAKIGPTLAKAVSTLEQAHEQILSDQGVDDLLKIAPSRETYFELLSEQIKGSSFAAADMTDASFSPRAAKYDGSTDGVAGAFVNAREFRFDGISYIVHNYNANGGIYIGRGSLKGGFARVKIDINGINVKPNRYGRDIFSFWVDRSGQLVPFGGSMFAWLIGEDSKYTSNGFYACNETTVSSGEGCAGSIFDNNLKVIYQ